MKQVLIVEDDPLLRIATKRVLGKQYEVTEAEDGLVALDLIQKQSFDAIVSDIEMPGLDGIQLYSLVAEAEPKFAPRFIFVSGGMPQETEEILRGLPNKYLRKPVNVQELREAVRVVADGR